MVKAVGLFILVGFVGIVLVSLMSGAMMTTNAPAVASQLEQVIPLSNQTKDEILDLTSPDPMTDTTLTDQDIEGMITRQVLIDPNYSHAEIEHPDTFKLVRDCLEQKGAYASFQIEKKKRFLRVCLIDDKVIGFQIVDVIGRMIKEKTAYVKDGIRSLKDLFEYTRKMGYPRYTGPL